MAASLTDRLRGIVSGGGAIPRLAPDVIRGPARVDPSGGSEDPPLPTGGAPSFGRSGPSDPLAIEAPNHAADVLGGEWIDRVEGRVLIVDRFYARDDQHGREGIDDLIETLTGGADALAALARAWPSRRDSGEARAAHPLMACQESAVGHPLPGSPGRQPPWGGFTGRQENKPPPLLFLDLETTGLAGGAGTQAFLVGCAFAEADGFRVRQFVLPGFEHERALLAEVAAWTRAHHGLVTFNGRTFDLPLIETRYLFHRLSFPLAGLPHLDMLHPARRLWKARPSIAGPPLDDDSCRLSVLERHLAGVHRVGDVPGFEIPSRYFQFVRDGNARPLEAVLEHNRLDLLSLALVTARAIRLLEHGPAQASHAWEAIGLGRIYERSGSRPEAEACYLHAAERARPIGREPLARAEALRRLALCRRRDGRTREAALAWEELLDVPGVPATLRHEAREALAIHYEHRAKDLRTARMLVLDALADHHSEARHRAATYRLQRLERKMSVRSEGGLLAALEAEL